MEIFMSNVPDHLTDRSLKTQLNPFIDELNIKHWSCFKKRSKKHAKLFFLREKDGSSFLKTHGVTPDFAAKFKEKANLNLLKSPIYCRRQKGEPDIWALKNLQYEVDVEEGKTVDPSIEHNSKKTKNDNNGDYPSKQDENFISFNFDQISCGHFKYLNDKMIFIPDVIWENEGTAKFKNKLLFIKINRLVNLEIPLNSILEVISGTSDKLMTISLYESPIMTESQSSHSVEDSQIEELIRMMISSGISNRINSQTPPKRRVCSIDLAHSTITQNSLVYSFKVSSSMEYQTGIERLKRLQSININSYDLKWKDPDVNYLNNINSLRELLEQYTTTKALSIQVLFQLQKLFHNGYLSAETIILLAKHLVLYNSNVSVDAMKKFMFKIPYPSTEEDPRTFDIQHLYKLIRKSQEEIENEKNYRGLLMTENKNLTLIHHVDISPTRIILSGPEWEGQNRILRKYPNHHDHFIRVRFVDEDGESVRFNPKLNQDAIFKRFVDTMTKGIQIAGLLYSFLGFSHSSLRSQTVWFCAPFVYNNTLHTNFNIIDALGSFSHITSPAKCAARIGQAFSDTPLAIPLDEYNVQINEIPDIESHNKQRVFTDGVGTISKDLVEIINSEYLPNNKGYPTCFQIRHAGAKGMLSLDSRLEGYQICIRPSMNKFPSKDTKYLELCDMASAPIPSFLNRQIIKLLEDMKVSKSWFFKLQKRELKRISQVMKNGKTISKYLKRKVGQTIGLSYLFQLIHELEIDFRQETFLRSIVEIQVLEDLRLLKHKARIPLDPLNEGVTLFGIADETGFLEENEVYVTFNDKNGIKKYPKYQKVLVTRSPALHPGDIQMARHVNPPKDSPLNYLRNCIVFSNHGSRDLPSQLSGGDLDGDIYNVIWAKEIIENKISTHKAADYPKISPKVLARPVEKQDMIEFFLEFMKTDHLGVIATRHMIIADQKEMGSLDPDCLDLAQLHSDAVDFSKSGVSVPINKLPFAKPFRPDFLSLIPPVNVLNRNEIDFESEEPPLDYGSDGEIMGSTPSYSHYKSEKILGELYRAIDEKKIWREDIHIKNVKYSKNGFWTDLLSQMDKFCNEYNIDWRGHSNEAQQILATYYDDIYNLMYDYSDHPVHLLPEVEVFVGSIQNKRGAQNRRQKDRSIGLRDHVNKLFAWISKYFRCLRNEESELDKEFDSNLDSTSDSDSDSSLEFNDTNFTKSSNEKHNFKSVELALACLHVSCDSLNEKNNLRRDDLVSFRIVSAAILRREMEYIIPGWTNIKRKVRVRRR